MPFDADADCLFFSSVTEVLSLPIFGHSNIKLTPVRVEGDLSVLDITAYDISIPPALPNQTWIIARDNTKAFPVDGPSNIFSVENNFTDGKIDSYSNVFQGT